MTASESSNSGSNNDSNNDSSDGGGQVSEVASLDPAEAETPISDSEQVAGYPDSESGSPETGDETGPEARSGSEQHDHRGHLED